MKQMKGCKKSKLSRYVLAALTVGMFSMVPVAYALPVAITDGSYTNVGGANISTNSVTKLWVSVVALATT